MTTKRCSKCGLVKSLDKFRKQSRNKDGYSHSCKYCLNKQQNDKQKETLDYISNIKKCNPCSICFNDDYRVLHFHHKRSEDKLDSISRMTRSHKNKINKEIDKCTILCANCHAIYHSYNYTEDKSEQLKMENKFKKIILT